MNKLRYLFSDEYAAELKARTKQIQDKMRENKHCRFCTRSIQDIHYEMGCEAGTDTYCTFFKKYRFYPEDNGQQCLFWEERKDG